MQTIKSIIVSFSAWIKSTLYLLYWFLIHSVKSDYSNHIKKNNIGESIDIIVNGPSFSNQVELVKNDGNKKCMVNLAANSSLFWALKPSYYCVSDPRFFLFARNNVEFMRFIDNLKKVDWDLEFFVTYYDYKKHIKNTELDRLPNIHFIPFHSTPLPFWFKYRPLAYWLFKKGQAMPIPMSVSVPVIMNIINSGFSMINLYGYDQDWIHNVVVDENNQVCLQDTHFYNEKGTYRPWKKNDSETFTMYEILQTQAELFESYWFIKEYVNYLGNVRIINKSTVSLIDAFDRE